MCDLFQLLEFLLMSKLQSHQNEAVDIGNLDQDGFQKLCFEEYIFCQFENVFFLGLKNLFGAQRASVHRAILQWLENLKG